MNWSEFAYARQLLAEEVVGTRVRQASGEEDSDFAAAVAEARRG